MLASTGLRTNSVRFHRLTIDGREPQSLLVFRALQVGDMLCATPALRALRTAYPNARITLAGLPWARDLARRLDRYVNDFVEFPGYPGLPERVPEQDAIPTFVEQIRKQRYDVAIQLHGSGQIVNEIVRRFAARASCGYYERPVDRLDPFRFMPYPHQVPEVRRHLRLLEFLGVPPAGEHLEYPLMPEDLGSLTRLFREHRLSAGQYVCVHAGSRSRTRRWLPERFAAVADELARSGSRVILTGSSDELELTRRVATLMKSPSLNLAGPMPLGTLAALLSRARLLVCNDTGVSHLASALRVPSVVIFTGSDPERWAPLNSIRHRGLHAAVDCRPCNYADCPIGQPCAQGVTTEAVLEAVKGALQQEMAYAI